MAANASGRANRVRPDGQVDADAARGLYWGNRGQLLDPGGRPARHSAGRLWIICVLEFNGRHRTQWQPGRLTELYFLDEATGLAAGHRPCGECRYHDYLAFREAWQRSHPSDLRSGDIDRRLHADRLETRDRHRTHVADAGDLPDGTMVVDDGGWSLLRAGHLHTWTHAGYGPPRPGPLPSELEVATPEATVEALRNGYRPVVHPSAETNVT